jgi:DNA-binding NtrC family response regulator
LADVPFVPKPFDLDLIVEVVSRQLNEKRSDEAASD